jgi:hypothetical protein
VCQDLEPPEDVVGGVVLNELVYLIADPGSKMLDMRAMWLCFKAHA